MFSSAHHWLIEFGTVLGMGEILAGLSGSDAAALVGVVLPPWRAFGIPLFCFLLSAGGTLGPVHWSGQQRCVDVASLPEGAARVLSDLWAWWCGVEAMPFHFQGVECRA